MESDRAMKNSCAKFLLSLFTCTSLICLWARFADSTFKPMVMFMENK